MLILVDAMGGDKAPGDIVDGCIDALKEAEGYDIMLLGDVNMIDSAIKKRKFLSPRLKVFHTSEVIPEAIFRQRPSRQKRIPQWLSGFAC